MNYNSSPRIGINGFGRIGFCILRLCTQMNIPVVAINSPNDSAEDLAYLFMFDTVHGRFDGNIDYEDDVLIVNGNRINITHEREPEKIIWKDVDYVVECTGKFRTQKASSAHLHSGVKKVIISAPPKDDTPMFVMGVNEEKYLPSMNIVSSASCTTNCLAPLVKIINDNFGVECGLMTTIHSVTSKQKTVDGHNQNNQRDARAAYNNIIPSTTGAAESVGKILPELMGKLTGIAMRVPILNCSSVDLSVNIKTPATYDDICSTIRNASKTYMKGFVNYWDLPVVSSDFIGDTCSCNFDATAGLAISPTFVKLIAWYDNEMSYSSQLIRLIMHMHSFD